MGCRDRSAPYLIPAIIVAVVGAEAGLWASYLPHVLNLPWFIKAPILISVVLGFVPWLAFRFAESSGGADSDGSDNEADKKPE